MYPRPTLLFPLTIAVMSTFLLLSYVLLRLGEDTHKEAALLSVPILSTDTWGIFNPDTGTLRYGNDIDTVRPIASITKLFTAYAVLESGVVDATTTIRYGDLLTEGDSGKLAVGQVYSLRTLLFPLLIESSNDAALVMKRILGDELQVFVNEFKDREGLTATAIVEPSGLSPRNVSTVQELARAYVAIRRDHPHILDITQLRMYLGGPEGLINNDPVRTLPSFTGGKNGYTTEAGRTFVGTLTVGTEEIGIVLLDSSDILKDVEIILDSYN